MIFEKKDGTTTAIISFFPQFDNRTDANAFLAVNNVDINSQQTAVQVDKNTIKNEYIFVVDISQSMSRNNRISLMKKSLIALIEVLITFLFI